MVRSIEVGKAYWFVGHLGEPEACIIEYSAKNDSKTFWHATCLDSFGTENFYDYELFETEEEVKIYINTRNKIERDKAEKLLGTKGRFLKYILENAYLSERNIITREVLAEKANEYLGIDLDKVCGLTEEMY